MMSDGVPEGSGGAGPDPAPAGAARRAIRQKRPFRTLSQEASLSVLVAAERLRRRMTAMIAPWGITTQQYNVLRILRGAHPDPLPTLEIGERMIEATPGVTRLMDRLEEKGWVARVRCPEDRRQVNCSITDEGLALLEELEPHVDAFDDAISEVFDEGELKMLARLLDRLIDSVPDRAT